MRIQLSYSNKNINHKGYDARPIKGFLMSGNPFGIAREMQVIGEKEGFKIYSALKGGVCEEGIPRLKYDAFEIWAQDMWTIVKNQLISYKNCSATNAIKECFCLADNPTQQLLSTSEKNNKNKHISGGNIFLIKSNLNNEILVGEDELKTFTLDDIMKIYDSKNITILPQMDFHLDMFIRPLNNKRILLADDELSLNVLKEGQEKFLKFLSTLPENKRKDYHKQKISFQTVIDDFIFNIKNNNYAREQDVEKKLLKQGFEVIRVPGRIYESYMIKKEPSLRSLCNYINANVFENKNGELVYITNKSCIDDLLELTPDLSKKIGFSFEDSFISSILPYIKKEHIYFIEGQENYVKNDMLPINEGGIHCACCEIPKETVINE